MPRDDEYPGGVLFDYITPTTAIIGWAFGRKDYWDYIPDGWSGNDVMRVLRQAGCRPKAMECDPNRRTFIVSVKDKNKAKQTIELHAAGRGAMSGRRDDYDEDTELIKTIHDLVESGDFRMPGPKTDRRGRYVSAAEPIGGKRKRTRRKRGLLR